LPGPATQAHLLSLVRVTTNSQKATLSPAPLSKSFPASTHDQVGKIRAYYFAIANKTDTDLCSHFTSFDAPVRMLNGVAANVEPKNWQCRGVAETNWTRTASARIDPADLAGLFPRNHAGRFVDLGHFEPAGESSTTGLEQAGWRGTCVTPSATKFKATARGRPLCHAVHGRICQNQSHAAAADGTHLYTLEAPPLLPCSPIAPAIPLSF
jgi:hypothetical protein